MLKNSRLIFVLTLVLVFMLSISSYQFQFKQAKQDIIIGLKTNNLNTLKRIKTSLEQNNKKIKEKIKLFSIIYLDEINFLVKYPKNKMAYKQLEKLIHLFFPNSFSFTLATNFGEVIAEEFDGIVGVVCKEGIREFAITKHRDLELHRNPNAYHIDYMVEVDNEDKNILFVSFYPELISSILGKTDTNKQKIVILNSIKPTLIDFDKDLTSFTEPSFDYLSEQHLNNPTINKITIDGSLWDLVIYSDEKYLTEKILELKQKMQWIWVILTAIIIIILLIVIQLIIYRLDAKKHLIKQNRLFSSFISTIPDMAFVLDRKGNYIDVFGGSLLTKEFAETVVGKNISFIFPPEIVTIGLEIIKKALDTKEIQYMEYPVPLKGDVFWHEGRVIAMEEGNAKPTQVLWLARNINDRVVAEAKFKAIVESGNDFVLVATSKGLSYASPSAIKLSGYTIDDFKNRKPTDRIHIDDLPQFLYTYKQCLATENSCLDISAYRAQTKSGAWVWLEGTISNLLHVRGVEGLVLIVKDVTDKIKAQQALALEEGKFRALIEKSSDIIAVFNTQWVISYTSPSLQNLLGYEKNFLIGKKTADMVHTDDLSILKESFGFILKHPGESYKLPDIRIKHVNGSYIIVEGFSTALLDTPGIEGIVFNAQDVTEKRKNEQKIHRQAFYDSLTNLPNRSYLLEYLEKVISLTKRHKYYSAIAFLDLDHFKNVNDSLGHNIGDKLLKQVAKRLHKHIRVEDLLARLGGDEFIIVLQEVAKNENETIDKLDIFSQKIIQAMSKKFVIDGHELFVSPSIGLKMFSNDTSETCDELLRHADGAMYKAKSLGRNQFIFYEDDIQEKADHRLQLEKDLHVAIKKQQFSLYYQPQYTCDKKMVGAESLVRWNHPQKGLVSPLSFIPIAEDTGLIKDIGKWVIERAFTDLQTWLEKGEVDKNFVLAINISPVQFNDVKTIETIKTLIKQHPDLKGMIQLEITESLLMDSLGVARQVMNELIVLGIEFSLDDFGTGYSSLQYLTHLPIKQLKIDKSFIVNIEKDKKDFVVVEMIIAMAYLLNLEVVAEGVETKQQLKFLQGHGNPIIQGYYFSKPLNVKDFCRELEKNKNLRP